MDNHPQPGRARPAHLAIVLVTTVLIAAWFFGRFGAADADFSCRFDKVDWENGGSCEVHADEEESEWATCALEIKTHRDDVSAPASAR